MKPATPPKTKNLSPQQYAVCFLGETEPPFSGKYTKHFQPGTYACAACGNTLFFAKTKYDSRTGWPAFWDTAGNHAVRTQPDTTHGMQRTEVRCAACGVHLGHVFRDGPEDKTGLRYCINSLSLEFVPDRT